MDSPLEPHSVMAVTRTLPAPYHTLTTAISVCTSQTSTSHGTGPYNNQGEPSKIPASCVETMEDFYRMNTQASKEAPDWATYGTG